MGKRNSLVEGLDLGWGITEINFAVVPNGLNVYL